jgi:hypothetical protein
MVSGRFASAAFLFDASGVYAAGGQLMSDGWLGKEAVGTIDPFFFLFDICLERDYH